MKHAFFLLIAAGTAFFSTGCSTLPPAMEIPVPQTSNLTPVQNLLMEGAQHFAGASSLKVNGRSYAMDCTGTILAIYAYAGIDLAGPMNNFTGNGVNRLNSYLQSLGLIYSTELPEPGDIIFWDDTYDRNGDGLWNDPLTHAGIVLTTDPDGTIHYIHHNYRLGIVIARMNLLKPDTVESENKRLNSAMRMRDGKVHPRWLSSHLYRELGQGWKIAENKES